MRVAREAGGSVLVHCQMGKSRSVTVAAACLMLAHGIGWQDALQQVQRALRGQQPIVAAAIVEERLEALAKHRGAHG